jgi:hypothetical protein
MLYRGQKRMPEAETTMQRSVAMFEKAMGPDAPALAPVLRDYAQLCRLENKNTQAAELDARARKLAPAQTAEGAAAKK